MNGRWLVLATLLTCAAQAAPLGTLAYLRAGAAWVEPQAGQTARRLPNSAGARLVAVSPASGAVAFMTASVPARPGAAPVALIPWLSRRPYTTSEPLQKVVPDPGLKTVRARWLAWGEDGRTLMAGTDAGAVVWDLVTRRRIPPGQLPTARSTSRDGDVTATSGTVQSPDEPGVLLYGPGARPGTELFSVRDARLLTGALGRQPQDSMKQFRKQLDPRLQADERNWTVSVPRVTPDGRRVYFASNAGWGVGSAGDTTSVVFEVDVTSVRVQALGWLGTFEGHVQDVRPSPDGRRLLMVVTRHVSNADVQTFVYAADLTARRRRELVRVDAGKGTLGLLDSVCWLADGRHVALSVAYPRQQDLTAANSFTPPSTAFTLVVKDAATGQTVHRVPGATGVACGPR
ncbi:hypothetical protein [Deinococcus hohokamensis]|uniref:WD40 repeat domain-containing protein n=1 Tax=Deinococcus hohokamensis TaxID=309883 RepID=A0ABV9ICY6_9DEIO